MIFVWSVVPIIPVLACHSWIEITKLDSTTRAPLPGVKFKIYKKDNANNYIQVGSELTSNALGVAVSANFSPGEYFVKETSALSGYVLDSAYHPVTFVAVGGDFKGTITLCNVHIQYPIEITKLDDFTGLPLPGAKFQIYKDAGGEKVAVGSELTSNEFGIATSGLLEPGDYFVKETYAPNGYELDSSYHAVKVSVGQSNAKATITLRDIRTQYPIEITKLDDITGLPLAGAKFQIYQDVDDVKVAVGAELTSDDSGIATSGLLAPGDYFVQETFAPNGYELDSSYHAVTVSVGQSNCKATIIMRNINTQYPIEILKLDDYTGLPLAGARFQIYQDVDDVKVAVGAELTSDDSGIATSGLLAPGDYFVQETFAPNGYELDSSYHAVTVSVGQSNAKATITLRDIRTQYPIEILKLDDYTGLSLAGARFQIYQDVDDVKVAVGSELTSDDSGIATSGLLDPGDYFVKETFAPNGYELDSSYHAVTVSVGQSNAKATITLRDIRTQYPIEIVKLVGNTGLPLAGAKFQIYQDVEGVKVAVGPELTSNTSGIATSGLLNPGEYFVKETFAPNGYELDSSYHAVTVSVGQSISKATITVFNDPSRFPIEILKLDNKTGLPLAGAKFQIYQDVEGVKVAVGPELTSNTSGIATSGLLNPGEYFVKETYAPSGYILDSTFHSITIAIGQSNGKATITLRNVPTDVLGEVRYPMSIEILKLDDTSGLPLAGAKFQVYQEINGVKVAVGSEFVSNASGIALSGLLKPGDYFLKETGAPTGYKLDNTYHAVKIIGGKVENEKITITLRNVKTDVLGAVKTGESGNQPAIGVALVLLLAFAATVTVFVYRRRHNSFK